MTSAIWLSLASLIGKLNVMKWMKHEFSDSLVSGVIAPRGGGMISCIWNSKLTAFDVVQSHIAVAVAKIAYTEDHGWMQLLVSVLVMLWATFTAGIYSEMETAGRGNGKSLRMLSVVCKEC